MCRKLCRNVGVSEMFILQDRCGCLIRFLVTTLLRFSFRCFLNILFILDDKFFLKIIFCQNHMEKHESKMLNIS